MSEEDEPFLEMERSANSSEQIFYTLCGPNPARSGYCSQV